MSRLHRFENWWFNFANAHPRKLAAGFSAYLLAVLAYYLSCQFG